MEVCCDVEGKVTYCKENPSVVEFSCKDSDWIRINECPGEPPIPPIPPVPVKPTIAERMINFFKTLWSNIFDWNLSWK